MYSNWRRSRAQAQQVLDEMLLLFEFKELVDHRQSFLSVSERSLDKLTLGLSVGTR